MILVIQRVKTAEVIIDKEVYSKIEEGLLILLGVCKGDSIETPNFLAKKVVELRIFTDTNYKMNLSVKDIEGELLIVSQFTLCSDKGKNGNRPSFVNAELPDRANELYKAFISETQNIYDYKKIKSGVFAAKMQINLINDGPVTIILEK